MNKKAHVAIRITLLALILVFMIVCGLHLGGLSHDDGNGKHSIATAIVVALAIALALQAAANREGVWPPPGDGRAWAVLRVPADATAPPFWPSARPRTRSR